MALNTKDILSVPLVFLLLAGLYLSPGTEAFLERRVDTVLSDDTDPSTLPYSYESIQRVFSENPTDLFFGAVFVDRGSPSGGSAVWFPWIEKWTAIAAAPFINIEQISTFFIFFLLALNGVAMFVLCRYLDWTRSTSYALGIAWAFNAYTLARAKVHMALAGTFHLPLIFLGLALILKGRNRKTLFAAAVCFLTATTTAHYLILTAAFVSPFFVFYLVLEKGSMKWRELTIRTGCTIAPAILFLGFCFKFPIPPRISISPEKLRPQSLQQISPGTYHPFLTRFATHPIDYITGNVAFGRTDLNPVRGELNEFVLTHLDDGFAHERAAGIRWIILLLFALSPLLAFKLKNRRVTTQILFFACLAFAGFWLSLAPEAFGFAGPSAWLFKLSEAIRVPSRANILVHFATLMIAGIFINELAKKPASEDRFARRLQKWILLPGLLPALVILELPPLLQPMPMAPMRPRLESIAREKGACGAGLHFPVTNFDYLEVHHYHFIQQMRGSDCVLLNNDQTRGPELALLNHYPYHPQFFKALNDPIEGPKIAADLERLVRCVPITWIAFDPATSPAWREQMCKRLNWNLNAELICTGASLAAPLKNSPEECLK